MRTIERLLTGTCLGISLAAGSTHSPQWLLLPPICFAGLLLAESHAVNQRIGLRTWPSAGYARFLFGTNLYLAIRNTIFSAALYFAAAQGASILGAI